MLFSKLHFLLLLFLALPLKLGAEESSPNFTVPKNCLKLPARYVPIEMDDQEGIVDRKTGLVWSPYQQSPKLTKPFYAKRYCQEMEPLGRWRFPENEEAPQVPYRNYWTSRKGKVLYSRFGDGKHLYYPACDQNCGIFCLFDKKLNPTQLKSLALPQERNLFSGKHDKISFKKNNVYFQATPKHFPTLIVEFVEMHKKQPKVSFSPSNDALIAFVRDIEPELRWYYVLVTGLLKEEVKVHKFGNQHYTFRGWGREGSIAWFEKCEEECTGVVGLTMEGKKKDYPLYELDHTTLVFEEEVNLYDVNTCEIKRSSAD